MSFKSRISWRLLLLVLTPFLVHLRADADPILIVSDGVNSSGAITLTNGSGNYVNESFSGSWSVVITTGQSKPALGSAISPNMELDIVATSLGSTNPLTITLSDNNFSPIAGNNNAIAQFIGHAFGGTGDVLTFNTYTDTNNTLGALTSLLTTSGDMLPDGGNQYSSTAIGSLSLCRPYALSEVVQIGGTKAASYSLSVNLQTAPQVIMPPTNSFACAGGTAYFSINAVGPDLLYQWFHGSTLLPDQTNSVLTLTNVTGADAGIYSVVVSSDGSQITNSAVLLINPDVSVAPLPDVTNIIGASVTFTAVASGTGPFSYQWFHGADSLTNQTNSTLTLNNLQLTDAGQYSVSVSGQCGNPATVGFMLNIDHPVVSIKYPTNGQVFIAPATFNVMACASDPYGTVTNVEFLLSTDGTNFNFLGQTNNTPYLTIASNLPPGTYTFVAQATDNFGATAQSSPVTVQVVSPQPPTTTVIGHMTLNLQDGYQWLSNVVYNPTGSRAESVRVYVHNITNSTIKVVNASGTTNGLPYIQSPAAIQPGTSWTNIIMFYDPYGFQFSPTLTVELVPAPNAAGNPTGVTVPMLPAKMLADGTFLIEFASINGATYYVQYSSDMVNWNTAFPAITGTGQHMQWIDSGPPATASLPAANVTRFYRVIQAQ